MQDQQFESALEYIYGLTLLGWKPGLERFTALCERLGSPHKKVRAIHIGGTNGKGSTTAMVSSILKSAGYRVGTYYSPYVYNIRERVQLDCGMISKAAFTRLIDVIRPHAAAIGETDLGHPTEFEVKTALALLYFVEQNVDFAVLEVGLGGRLDATNIVEPLVSVITNVTLDHMDRLGNTIPEIASEKAGIIKRNGHLVTAVTDTDAFSVIRRTCEEKNSRLWHVNHADGGSPYFSVNQTVSDYTPTVWEPSVEDGCTILSVDGIKASYPDLKLRMLGSFQMVNAATAVGVVEALREKGIDIPESAVRAGLESAYLPGRLEVLQEKPMLLIDGAHNLDGADQLAKALKHCFKYDKLILVMGMVSGHSMDDVLGILAPLADKFYATASGSARAAKASDIAEVAQAYCKDVSIVEPVSEAVIRALQSGGENDLVCVTGSFYTIGEVPRPHTNQQTEV